MAAAALAVVSLSAGATFPLLLWLLLFLLAMMSATQDIAIDAYAIEILEPSEMGPANGIRVTFYRLALILAGGILVALAGKAGWRWSLTMGAALMALLGVFIFYAPEPDRMGEPPLSLDQAVIAPFRRFFAKPGFWLVMMFILLFKVGDYALTPMTKPFWVDRNFTPFQIGLVPGTVGIAGVILGALIGGHLTSRWGIFKALWILGAFQAVSNLVYALAAYLPASPALLYAAVIVENICGGLGTASFLSFLMSICDKEFAATQYALLSALFGLGRSLAGAFSGYGAVHLGYGVYFIATFFLALPAFFLLPWVRRWAPDGKPSGAA